MLLSLIENLQRTYYKDPLKYLELAFLSLMLLSLPSLEAPKNIFLFLFICTSIWNQFNYERKKDWELWDWIFLSYISSAFFSAFFAGYSPGDEWSSFRAMLFWLIFGWTLSRTNFSSKEVNWLIWVVILSTIPPLTLGLFQLFFLHTKDYLELHSVGHVNHSAIYLGIILGATLSMTLSFWHFVSLSKKLGLMILPIFFFWAVVIGQSRGVFGISLLRISLLTFLIPNPKKTKALTFVLFCLMLLLVPIMQTGIVDKQISDQKNNNILSGRDRIYSVSKEAFNFYPIFGIGNGNWYKITPEKIKASLESKGEKFDPDQFLFVRHAHSIYLSALIERGIIGFLTLLLIQLQWVNTIIKSYRMMQSSTLGSCIWGASLSAWIVTFGVGFVNSTFHHETAILALFFLGLHISYLRKIKGKLFH
jgi:O-antigen ligase